MSQQELICTRCGKAIAPGAEQMGQKLITAMELARMAVMSPAMLTGPALPDVSYCAECRPIIARERTAEQLKVLVALMVVLALVFGLVYLIGMG